MLHISELKSASLAWALVGALTVAGLTGCKQDAGSAPPPQQVPQVHVVTASRTTVPDEPEFIGQAEGDHQPLLTELVRQVGTELGETAGVLVFDPSAFPKKGTESVGVQRQWCGRLGKIDNCQVGLYLGYVSRREHALVDFRLYLPKEWAQDRQRRKKARVPKQVRFETKPQLAAELIRRTVANGHVRFDWIVADDHYGQNGGFLDALETARQRYMVETPITTTLRRVVKGSLTSPNFCKVVKITPPDAHASNCCKCSRPSACTGVCRIRSRHMAKVANNWSSRSLRSVSTTSVGFSIAGCRITRPA